MLFIIKIGVMNNAEIMSIRIKWELADCALS